MDHYKREYLTTIESDFSIEEKKWILKSKLEDIDLERKWKNENILCGNCPNIEFNQRHLFECQFLIRKKLNCNCYAKYEDLFREDIEEQICASRILKENYFVMKAFSKM